jgi:hypothetical protein
MPETEIIKSPLAEISFYTSPKTGSDECVTHDQREGVSIKRDSITRFLPPFFS